MQINDVLNTVFDEIAKALNISDTMGDKAVGAYTSLGEWLEGNEEGEEVEVYPQGSFALGTVVRPLNGEDDDYDIDLVCRLPGMARSPAPEIKGLVGRRLKQHGTYASKMDSEGKRCWTLEYDEFHVDVLPCTDELGKTDKSIRLTHKDLDTGVYSDRYGNPKGYKSWFERQMGESLTEAKRRYGQDKKVYCSIDDVPTYAVKTPLQKAVQFLKQHRNVTFAERRDAPVSILITTLAAHAYEGEGGTYDAVVGILSRMGRYVEGSRGSYKVLNPATPEENFAEKWNDDPKLAEAFSWWLGRAREDFGNLAGASGLDELTHELGRAVGDVMAKRAMNTFGESMHATRNAAGLLFSSAGLATAVSAPAASRVVPKHQFYGV